MTMNENANLDMHIEKIKKILQESKIHEQIDKQSGTVFYNGYETLFKNNGVYIIGLNPGGIPDKEDEINKKHETIWQNLDNIKKKRKDYNAYLHECWNDGNKCLYDSKKCYNTFQTNIQDAFSKEKLNLELCEACGSNLVFQRSRNTYIIDYDKIKEKYIYVHDYIINEIIHPSVIIAVGKKVYNVLKKYWIDDVKEQIPLNIAHGRPVSASPCYIESKDETKVLCYLPHFSRQSHYYKFSKCENAIVQMRNKIHEKLENPSNWKFKKTWQSLL